MDNFPAFWIIHLQTVFMCILHSEEDVSWTSANSLLDWKYSLSLKGFKWVTVALHLYLFLIFITSCLCTVSNSAVSLPAKVHGHNHWVLLELVYSVLFWTVTLFEVSLINIQRSVRHHFESVAQWLRPSFLFKVFWENPYCPSPAWWRWLEK